MLLILPTMPQTRRLLLTFDYELYLGDDSGSVEKCLLRPTQMILDWCSRNEVSAIFFIDTTYLARLKERTKQSEQAAADLKQIVAQVRSMRSAGHDVFPHLHPHWLDAVYDAGQNRWRLTDLRYYRFDSCPGEIQTQLYAESVEFLRDILGEHDYIPEGYRAGGWCIQPFSDFKEHFMRWKTAVDFSVVPGKAACTTSVVCDFSNAPRKTSYRFSGDVVVEKSDGPFVEIPISTVIMSRLEHEIQRWCGKVFWRLGSGKRMGDGSGVRFDALPSAPTRDDGVEMASLDGFNLGKVPAYLRHLNNRGVLHLCSHPKLLSPHALAALGVLLRILKRKHQMQFNWRALIPAIQQ